MENKRVYIVMGQQSDYDSYYEWAVAAFDNADDAELLRSSAQEHAENQTKELEEVRKVWAKYYDKIMSKMPKKEAFKDSKFLEKQKEYFEAINKIEANNKKYDPHLESCKSTSYLIEEIPFNPKLEL